MADVRSVASAVSSVADSVTQRGVRDHIKKQLANDIEQRGGIQHFAGRNNQNLKLLLQLRAEDCDNPYGNPGDSFRIKIRKLINYWAKKDREGKYVSEVLNPWRIIQYSTRTDREHPITSPIITSPPPTTPRRRKESDNISLSSSGSDSSVAATARRNPRTSSYRSPRTPFDQVVIDTKSRPPTTPLTPLLVTQGILKMSMKDDIDQKKRKIGTYDIDVVGSQASKFREYE